MIVLQLPSGPQPLFRNASFIACSDRKLETRHYFETPVLSPGRYVVVPYSLNALHNGAPPRRFVLAAHAAKHFTLQTRVLSPVEYGMALIEVARNKGGFREEQGVTYFNVSSLLVWGGGEEVEGGRQDQWCCGLMMLPFQPEAHVCLYGKGERGEGGRRDTHV